MLSGFGWPPKPSRADCTLTSGSYSSSHSVMTPSWMLRSNCRRATKRSDGHKVARPVEEANGCPALGLTSVMIHTARSHQGDLSDFLRRFRYQRELTAKLDALPNAQFSQETINEIILWKVNRYARLSDDVRKALYALRALKPLEHRSG